MKDMPPTDSPYSWTFVAKTTSRENRTDSSCKKNGSKEHRKQGIPNGVGVKVLWLEGPKVDKNAPEKEPGRLSLRVYTKYRLWPNSFTKV